MSKKIKGGHRASDPEYEKEQKKAKRKATRKKGIKTAGDATLEQLKDAGQIVIGAGNAISGVVKADPGRFIAGLGQMGVGAGSGIVHSIKHAWGMIGAITGHNSQEWYTRLAEKLLITGPNFNTQFNTTRATFGNSRKDFSLPHVAGIETQMALGDTTAVKVEMKRLLQSMAAVNSGQQYGSTSTLTYYIMLCRSMIAAYASGCRALRLLASADAKDPLFPRSVMRAAGLDYTTFADHSGQLREEMARLRAVLNQFAIPPLSVFERTAWLYTNVFGDSNDAKCQVYVYKPGAVANPVLLTQGGTGVELLRLSGGRGVITYDDYITTVRKLYNTYASLSATNMNMVSAIARIFPTSGFKFADVPSVSETQPIMYSEEALQQLQNSTLGVDGDVTMAYDEAQGGVIEQITIKLSDQTAGTLISAGSGLNNERVINMYKDDITPVDIITTTRFTNMGEVRKIGEQFHWVYTNYGTEIVIGVDIEYLNTSGTPAISSLRLNGLAFELFSNNEQLSCSQAIDIMNAVSMASYFDWMPNFQFYLSDGTSYVVTSPVVDINNFAFIDNQEQMSQMHYWAVRSLFTSPDVRKVDNLQVIE